MNDTTFTKLPPQAIEAEESIISAALLGAAQDVAELVSSEDFYRSAHKKIFAAIEELVNSRTEVDLITVSSKLRDKNELDEVGGASYLSRMIDTVPSSASVKDHAKIIKSAAQKREIIRVCHETIQQCFNGHNVDDILGELDKSTGKIATHTGRFYKMGDLLEPMIERLGNIAAERKAGKDPLTGIKCGLHDIDRHFGGFQPATLYVVGARPSMGKSALGTRFLRGAGKLGTPGLFISIEMSKEQTIAREVSCESGVDSERFRSGYLSDQHWEQITEAAGRIDNLPVWIDDSPTAKIKVVQSKIRQFYKLHGHCLVVIDYLQYIKGLESERKDIEIGTITRGLKASAKEYGIPIILLAQLNRDLEKRNDKRPEIADLRGSGEIEQDADIISFLYRDEVYNKDENNPNRGVAEFITKKFRDGKLGTVFLAWIGHRATFENFRNDKSTT
ncbi:MAG: replicative DNA helicase [Candidatus Vecturithrix sp.]|nr:replicative DNA helicase [Candidatus Vecturithrix sp.]